jgi:hypothetical protein
MSECGEKIFCVDTLVKAIHQALFDTLPLIYSAHRHQRSQINHRIAKDFEAPPQCNE